MAQETEKSWQFPQDAKEYIAWAEKIVREIPYFQQDIIDGFKVRWYAVNPQIHKPKTDPGARRILVLSPHPDDAEFAAAVTMHDHVNRGDSVSVLLCTCGSAGRYNRGFTEKTAPEVRLAEALKSAEITGIQRVGVIVTPEGKLGLPEWLWDGNDISMRRLGIALMRLVNPNILYSPPAGKEYDSHPDHNAVGYLAQWMTNWGMERDFYQNSFPGQASNFQEWRLFTVWPGERNLPADHLTVYQRGGPFEDIKRMAMTCHWSQHGDYYALAALERDGFEGTMRFVGQDQCPLAEVFAVRRAPIVNRLE